MEKSGRPRTALNECVKVVVRCRPLSEKERTQGHDEEENEKGSLDQKWYERLSSTKAPEKKPRKGIRQVVKVCPERGAVQVLNPKGQDKVFTYDAAYDHTADTQTIYDEMVRPLVSSVLDGFNGCVFAYGQTGTGKTHTMEGREGDEGVIPRAFRQIWTHIETSASSDITHLVSCSYVELYLEDIRDLLSKDCKKLTIRGQIWTHIETSASSDVTHLVSCSYVELYLEDIRDLLSKDCKKLTIRGQIWTHIETSASSDITHLVSCSYVELYLEDIRDLLSKDCKKLTIRGQIWTHIETSASSDITHLVSCSYVELYLEDIRDLLSKDCKKLTIRGQDEDVMFPRDPYTFRQIWTHIETSASSDITHLVSCSYIELYLEDIRDLLSKDCKKLTIRGQIWTHIETLASSDITHLVSCSYVELYLEDIRDLLSKDCKKLTIRGQIWTHIETSASSDITHLVSCSYVELYLEDIRDLLSKDCKKLTIKGQIWTHIETSASSDITHLVVVNNRENLKTYIRDLLSKDCKKLTIRGQELNGFYIPEMTSIVCKSAAEMVRVMKAGNRNRASGRTDMNEHSSRSHAVFLVTVESAHRPTNRIRNRASGRTDMNEHSSRSHAVFLVTVESAHRPTNRIRLRNPKKTLLTGVMKAGNRNRASGRTDMNEHSSRSHAVFLVTVESAHRPTNRIRSVQHSLHRN
ncbi:kinesin motor domain-containing protein [Phthorimaea operculella]|nr:kinesin motor domain-containing protein [Phthorimaea operculella]